MKCKSRQEAHAEWIKRLTDIPPCKQNEELRAFVVGSQRCYYIIFMTKNINNTQRTEKFEW